MYPVLTIYSTHLRSSAWEKRILSKIQPIPPFQVSLALNHAFYCYFTCLNFEKYIGLIWGLYFHGHSISEILLFDPPSIFASPVLLWAIQVLRNADGGEGVSNFPGKKCYEGVRSMLLALRGGGWGFNFQERSVTQCSLEWPLRLGHIPSNFLRS